MPQVISARPFEELDLGHSLRLDPNAVPHSRLWPCPNNGTKERSGNVELRRANRRQQRASVAISKVQ
jgi:hypothetical protein